MAKNAVVFSGRNGLDFHELRSGVLRIPEVTARLRQAQGILDSMELVSTDLINSVSSDDEFFFRNIKLKSLLAAVVQVGLFDRYLKTQRRPDFLVGNSNGDSALMVCTGRMTFEELVRGSQALEDLKPALERVVIPMAAEPAPLLTGISLTEYQAWRAQTNTEGVTEYTPIHTGLMDLKKVVSALYAEQQVSRYVNVGPASALRGSDYRSLGNDEVESLDSIELDPMLGWFWRGVRPQAIALAQ